MNTLIEFNDKLMGAPSGVLVFLFCIGIGYGLKMLKKFPNDGIPVAVMLVGCIAFAVLAPSDPKVELRIWIGRSVIIGWVIGTAAWLFHKFVLKHAERWLVDKIVSKFPSFDTQQFTKPKEPKE